MGFISKSNSQYNCQSPIARKANGQMRFTINLIPVNIFMEVPRYSIPFIEEIYERAYSKKYISILKLKDAFWQFVLQPKYRQFFAFTVASREFRGHEFNSIVQGSNVFASLFQKGIDDIIRPLYNRGVHAYIDNIYIFNDTQ